MPEGDTLHRTASQLSRVLCGETIRSARSFDRRFDGTPLDGRRVARVESRGKHLLIFLASEQVLHSHLGMTGSWHIYPTGQSWQKPRNRARLVLELRRHQVVCFTPKTLELLSPLALRRHPFLTRLGPDLLSESLDLDEIVRRLRIHDVAPIGEAVMNQTIACGIGNVYKSEVLFVTRITPFAAVGELSDELLRNLFVTAGSLLRRNLQGYPRQTRGSGDARLWVYGRAAEPCFKCGTDVRMRRQGDLGRSTYWCPACQILPKGGL